MQDGASLLNHQDDFQNFVTQVKEIIDLHTFDEQFNRTSPLLPSMVKENPNVYINSAEQTLLHFACKLDNKRSALTTTNRLKLIKFLINLGLNVNMKDNTGNTPLHYLIGWKASCYDELESKSIQCLLRDYDLSIANHDKNTILHNLATGSSKVDDILIDLLITVDTLPKNELGLTPLDIRLKDNDFLFLNKIINLAIEGEIKFKIQANIFLNVLEHYIKPSNYKVICGDFFEDINHANRKNAIFEHNTLKLESLLEYIFLKAIDLAEDEVLNIIEFFVKTAIQNDFYFMKEYIKSQGLVGFCPLKPYQVGLVYFILKRLPFGIMLCLVHQAIIPNDDRLYSKGHALHCRPLLCAFNRLSDLAQMKGFQRLILMLTKNYHENANHLTAKLIHYFIGIILQDHPKLMLKVIEPLERDPFLLLMIIERIIKMIKVIFAEKTVQEYYIEHMNKIYADYQEVDGHVKFLKAHIILANDINVVEIQANHSSLNMMEKYKYIISVLEEIKKPINVINISESHQLILYQSVRLKANLQEALQKGNIPKGANH